MQPGKIKSLNEGPEGPFLLPAIFHQKIFTSAALVEYTEKRGCGEAAWEEGTMSLFDSWADRYIKRYGIDAFKKRMEERK